MIAVQSRLKPGADWGDEGVAVSGVHVMTANGREGWEKYRVKPGQHYCTKGHARGECGPREDCLPAADPWNPELRLLRAVFGLCPECDQPGHHIHCPRCDDTAEHEHYDDRSTWGPGYKWQGDEVDLVVCGCRSRRLLRCTLRRGHQGLHEGGIGYPGGPGEAWDAEGFQWFKRPWIGGKPAEGRWLLPAPCEACEQYVHPDEAGNLVDESGACACPEGGLHTTEEDPPF